MILLETSSMRYIVYEIHHLQELDLLNVSLKRCFIYEGHWHLFLCLITAPLVRLC